MDMAEFLQWPAAPELAWLAVNVIVITKPPALEWETKDDVIQYLCDNEDVRQQLYARAKELPLYPAYPARIMHPLLPASILLFGEYDDSAFVKAICTRFGLA